MGILSVTCCVLYNTFSIRICFRSCFRQNVLGNLSVNCCGLYSTSLIKTILLSLAVQTFWAFCPLLIVYFKNIFNLNNVLILRWSKRAGYFVRYLLCTLQHIFNLKMLQCCVGQNVMGILSVTYNVLYSTSLIKTHFWFRAGQKNAVLYSKL